VQQMHLLPPLWQLTSLQELYITKMEGLQKLDSGFYGNPHLGVKPFKCLKTLWFEDLPAWTYWEPFPNKNEEFPSLQELQIRSCPELVESLPKHLNSLTKLVVSGCQKLQASVQRVPILKEMKLHGLVALTTLPKKLLAGNSCFQQMEIVNCPALISFPGGDSLATLKSVSISHCRMLNFFLPRNVMHQFGVLERLHIANKCDSPESLQLGLFTKLQYLHIEDCRNLKSLSIKDAVLIFLQEMEIKDCPNLKSLPKRRLHTCLPCLQKLEISNCPELSQFSQGSLPLNLQSLIISNCNNLTPQKEWGLHGMASLTCFEIEGGCSNVESFPEEGLLPKTLTSLHISRLSNLKFLDGGFEDLTSLETLEIHNCEKLEWMPAKGLPTNLTSLFVTECSLLGPHCQEGGVERPRISHIADIYIFPIPDNVNEQH
jgi:hypothetical protein